MQYGMGERRFRLYFAGDDHCALCSEHDFNDTDDPDEAKS